MIRLALAGLLLGGCALQTGESGRLADLIGALAKDPATACVQVVSTFGTVRLARTNLANGTMKCDPDGSLSVTSKAP